MVDHRETHGSGARWPALAVVAIVALLSGAVLYAAGAMPYMSITTWQKEKLAGTEFGTSPIRKMSDQYFLVRRLPPGGRFESIVQKYCAAAGINEEDCKAVAGLAAAYHAEEHTHRNWQPYDRIYLSVPGGVVPPAEPEP